MLAFRAMNTDVSVAASEDEVAVAERVLGIFRAAEQRFSRFIADSELSRLNRTQGPLDAVVTRLGLGAGVLPRLAGSSLWITSRAAGVTAFLALSLDVAFGLFISTGAADRAIPRARIVEAHRWLSAVTLALTALHAGALLGDRFVRFDVLDVLVPFVSSYRPLAVGLGLLAAYVAIVLHQSFAWRRRLGARLWRSLHYASFAAYAAALLHGVLAGTDARALSGVYLGSAALVASLVLYRIAVARRSSAAARG